MLFSLFPVSSEDIWWHVKLGELIASLHRFPAGEQLVHTVPAGTHFSDTQWLFQLLVFGVHKLAGWNGLIALRVLFSVGTALLVFAWLERRGTGRMVNVLCSSFIVLLVAQRVNDRPELPSFLCMGMQLLLLDGFVRGGRMPWWQYLLVQLVWANFHSSVVLGIFLPLTFGVTMLVQEYAANAGLRKVLAGRGSAGRRLVVLAAAAALVSLLNPSGWVILTYGFTESAKNVILEFGHPWNAALFSEGVAAMLLACVGAWRFAPAGQRLPWLAWGAVCAVEYLRVLRFLPYASISWAPLMAGGCSVLWDLARGPRVKWLIRAAGVLLLALAGAHTIYALSLNRVYGRGGVDDSRFPVGAADYILRNDIQGKIFNAFDEGGYLLYRLAPQRPVFMFNETRLNARTLHEGEEIHTPQAFHDWLDKYGCTYAVVPYSTRDKRASALTSRNEVFRKFADWVPVFWDDTAMVWLNDTAANRELIQRDRCVVNPESIPSRDNLRTDLGQFLGLKQNAKTWSAVGRECERLEQTPHHFKASFALGMWHDTSGTTPTLARDAYRRALALDGGIPELLSRLGQWHLRNGTPEEAIACFKQAVACATSWPDAMYNLALAQAKVGKGTEAHETVEEILKREPGNARALQLRGKLKQTGAGRR